jgi:hypothetical protein
LVQLARPTRQLLATTLSNGSANNTPCMLIQRACLGLFLPGKWWSTRCTSTRYIAHKSGTHRQPLCWSWR